MRHALPAVLLAASMAGSAAGAIAARPAACASYAADLQVMTQADQALRARWTFDASPGAEPPRIVQQAALVDRRNTERLKSLVAACGWPRRSVEGAAAVNDAWLLAQHADHDRPFQRRVLALLERAVAAGEAPADQLAYLSDRVDVAQGRPQRYGTQLAIKGACELAFEPLDDDARVDERRRALGWPTLAAYMTLVREHTLPPKCADAPGGVQP